MGTDPLSSQRDVRAGRERFPCSLLCIAWKDHSHLPDRRELPGGQKLTQRGWQRIPAKCDHAGDLTNLSVTLVFDRALLSSKLFGVLLSILCLPVDTIHKIWLSVDLWTLVNLLWLRSMSKSRYRWSATSYIGYLLSINQWAMSQWLLHEPKAGKHTWRPLNMYHQPPVQDASEPPAYCPELRPAPCTQEQSPWPTALLLDCASYVIGAETRKAPWNSHCPFSLYPIPQVLAGLIDPFHC